VNATPIDQELSEDTKSLALKHHGLGDLSVTKQNKTRHHKHAGPANR